MRITSRKWFPTGLRNQSDCSLQKLSSRRPPHTVVIPQRRDLVAIAQGLAFTRHCHNLPVVVLPTLQPPPCRHATSRHRPRSSHSCPPPPPVAQPPFPVSGPRTPLAGFFQKLQRRRNDKFCLSKNPLVVSASLDSRVFPLTMAAAIAKSGLADVRVHGEQGREEHRREDSLRRMRNALGRHNLATQGGCQHP
nr:hypothetical protein Iba_chr03aCG3000 [Ipomoea batatas]